MQLQCIAFLSCAVHLLARIPRPVCSILAGTMPEEDAGTEGLNVLVTLLIDESLPICRHLECVRYLLLEDADPFLVDRAHLRTALHCAAAYGHADVMAVLLEDDLVVSYCLLASFSGCCGAQNVLCRCVPLKFRRRRYQAVLLEDGLVVGGLCKGFAGHEDICADTHH